MNTIYEDLGEIFPRIKSKIRIKKVVKQQDSEGNEVYTLQNSSLLEDSLVIDPSGTPSQFSEKNRGDSLFASTLSTIENTLLQTGKPENYSSGGFLERRSLGVSPIFNGERRMKENSSKPNNRLNPKDQSKNENLPKRLIKAKKSPVINSTQNLFHSDFPEIFDCPIDETREYFKQPEGGRNEDFNEFKRKLFRSQSETNSKKSSFSEELKEFMLPNDVLKIIEDSMGNISRMRAHIAQEKLKIEAELNQFLSLVNGYITQKRSQLFKRFEDYLANFEDNYDLFLGKVKVYRERAGAIPAKGKDAEVSLKEISFEAGEGKLKSEKYSLGHRVGFSRLRNELGKKELLFLSNELNKQMTHLPQFNYSETSNSVLLDSKETLFSEMRSFFDNFDRLIYEAPLLDFSKVRQALRISSSVLGRESLNMIGELPDFSGAGVLKVETLETRHSEDISSVLVFDENSLVTACRRGEIRVWDASSYRLIESMQNNESVLCLGRFEGNEDELEGGVNLLKGLLMKSGRKASKYLITGGESSIRLWNLRTRSPVRELFNGYRAEVPGVLAVNDQQTVISACGNMLRVWNVITGREIRSLGELDARINVLFMMRDQNRFISGGNDGALRVWRLVLGFCNKTQRRVVDRYEPDLVFCAKTAIFSINQGFYDENLLVTGGLGVICLWDLKQKACKRELSQWPSDCIGQLVLVEEPRVESEEKARISVVHPANGEVRVWDFEEGSMKSDLKIICGFGAGGGPRWQLLKKVDEVIDLVGVNLRSLSLLRVSC